MNSGDGRAAADLEVRGPAELEKGNPDCWNSTGTLGTKTCQKLSQDVHCHQCPVYCAAATELLRRPVPEAFRQEWTQLYASPRTVSSPARTSVLLFRLGSEWLALGTEFLVEVSERRRIHSIPQRANGLVLGLANVRGELTICVAADQLLGLTTQAEHNRLLVTAWRGTRLAFPVEQVHGTERFHPEELKPLPANITRSNSNFTMGILHWKDHTVGVLDPDLFFAALNRHLG